MIVAVASGKGGTGKTTVAVSLALSLSHQRPLLVDCDVEEPNAALFLDPVVQERREVGRPVPEVDPEACTGCGRCAEVCQYHAIAVVGKGRSGGVLVFPELCHGCGSCAFQCPTGAIREVMNPMGVLERGWAGPVEFAQGTLRVGEAMAAPVIRQLKEWVVPSDAWDRPVILDAPPGTSCSVVETIRGADFVLLVTEPTPFGLHDLRLAVELAREGLGLPVGVVINRDGVGDRQVEEYCAAAGIPVLLRIPHDRRIAEAYSDGKPLVVAHPEYRERFRALAAEIVQRISGARDTLQVSDT